MMANRMPTNLQPQAPGGRDGLGETGATSLEWALLLGAVALVIYPTLTIALATLVEYYRMMVTLNALPFP